jgi:hypothetical protein
VPRNKSERPPADTDDEVVFVKQVGSVKMERSDDPVKVERNDQPVEPYLRDLPHTGGSGDWEDSDDDAHLSHDGSPRRTPTQGLASGACFVEQHFVEPCFVTLRFVALSFSRS